MNSEPKTLNQAREMIDDLRAEVKLLKGSTASTAKPPAATTLTPAIKPPVKPTPSPAPSNRSTDVVIRPEKPLTQIDQVRAVLNQTSDEADRTILYKKI